MNIHLVTEGSGAPLVLFHGWGFDHTVWSSLLPELTSHYRVYRVDLPGFGRTPLMDWDDFKHLLLKKLPASFALAGWSMGGLFATRLAIEESQQVTHLLNIASSPRFVKEDNWPGVERNVFMAFYRTMEREPQKTLAQFIALQLQEQTVHDVVSLATTPALTTSVLSGLRAGLDVLVDWDLREALQQVQIPVGYLFGRLDAITLPTTLMVMKDKYPSFHYHLFSKSAHVPFLSEKEKFLVALKEFLQ
ncbi:alpha/beta fold hydrolase [Legionella nagasakiensis]|uniref:alpha/beta fold hydrolase n=1 Tax=Legionella nagasakiensis TaxID=535290 RepID=UPI0010561E1D|nr:alpha/beta fold hydrolase [Legionella nagasakiensis]